MLKRLLISSVAVAAMAGCASAADIIDTSYDWSGFYAGINGGYAFGGNDDIGIRAAPFGGTLGFGKLDMQGGFGGIQIGNNWQSGSIVMGVEGDIQAGSVKGSFKGHTNAGAPGVTVNAKSKSDVFGTVRARLGFAADRALFYATGGLAMADMDYAVDVVGVASMKSTSARFGYVLGAGVEYAFDDAWSMKLEYQYLNFGRHRLTANAGAVSYRTEETPDWHLVKIGFNYKF